MKTLHFETDETNIGAVARACRYFNDLYYKHADEYGDVIGGNHEFVSEAWSNYVECRSEYERLLALEDDEI